MNMLFSLFLRKTLWQYKVGLQLHYKMQRAENGNSGQAVYTQMMYELKAHNASVPLWIRTHHRWKVCVIAEYLKTFDPTKSFGNKSSQDATLHQ